MAKSSGEFRRTLPALGAAIPIVIIFVAVLSIVLTAAGPRGLGLSDAQTGGWIVVVYGLPALPSLVLTFRYRQPLLLTGVSLAVPLVPLTAGPTAGDPSIRHRSVYVPAGALLVIAVLAGTAADLASLVPPILLLALAGLALVGVVVSSLREIARGPLLLGPIFAFAIALSDMRLLELGPFFWSLVLGTGVSLLLERDEWKRLRTDVVVPPEARSDEQGDLVS
jgi:predicted benzoate:H+ symporter BenE